MPGQTTRSSGLRRLDEEALIASWFDGRPPAWPRVAGRRRRAVAGLWALWALTACDTGLEPVFTRPNPLAGAELYVPVPSDASLQAAEWRETRPADAEAMDRIAREPRAIWLVDPDPLPELTTALDEAEATGAVPVLVAYFIPRRDCGASGAVDAAAYRAWVRTVAGALTGREAVVIVEPDALGHLDCITVQREERLASLRDAVEVLAATGAVVYLDAGHPRWLDESEAAARLIAGGVEAAAGFSLNVANFVGTTENVEYGQSIAARIGPTGFVIDTSRNGAGPAPDDEWCNPPGRKLGSPPTTSSPYAGVDALLWIKVPGESDGPCNGGPPAGEWWPEYALALAT